MSVDEMSGHNGYPKIACLQGNGFDKSLNIHGVVFKGRLTNGCELTH
jgi:hypothetical protein